MTSTILSIFAGLGGMIGWGTSDFFASISSGKIGHHKTFFWSQVAGLIFGLILIPFVGFKIGFSPFFLFLLIMGSCIYASGYLLMYKAFEIGNLSVVSAVCNMWAVWTILFTYIFLGQRLGESQWIAIAILLIGVLFVSVKLEDLKNKKINLFVGAKEGLVSAVIFGIFWTISDVLSKNIGWLELTIWIKVGAVLFLMLISLLQKKELNLKKTRVETKLIVFVVGILEMIGIGSVNFGLTIGDAILISPISSALSVVTISLAIIFLKEKITKLQGVGILLVVSGIILSAF